MLPRLQILQSGGRFLSRRQIKTLSQENAGVSLVWMMCRFDRPIRPDRTSDNPGVRSKHRKVRVAVVSTGFLPRIEEGLRRVAVGPDPGVVDLDVDRRSSSKDLPHRRPCEGPIVDRFRDAP